MDEDYLLPGSKDKVRISRQVASMQTVPVANAVKETPNDHLRFRIGASDAGHSFAAFRLR
jgi:hypothetical protein